MADTVPKPFILMHCPVCQYVNTRFVRPTDVTCKSFCPTCKPAKNLLEETTITEEASKIVDTLVQKYKEASAEAACCIEFLSSELGWEEFRLEFFDHDKPPGESTSERNAKKLRDFLQVKSHGVDFLRSCTAGRKGATAPPPDDHVVIMRSPCLMEDEGRHHFVSRKPRAEAEAWIAAQKDEYFKPGDYYIAETSNETI